jgi:hypothetical protein
LQRIVSKALAKELGERYQAINYIEQVNGGYDIDLFHT